MFFEIFFNLCTLRRVFFISFIHHLWMTHFVRFKKNNIWFRTFWSFMFHLFCWDSRLFSKNVTLIKSNIGGFRGGGDSPLLPPQVKLGGGCNPPGFLVKSLLRRLLTWNRSSMTTDRLVKLQRMAMHARRLASISEKSVFNGFFDGSRKLNYRRLIGFNFFLQKFIFFTFLAFFYF